MTPVDVMMNSIEWQEIESSFAFRLDDGVPYATHEGKLNIGGFEFECYQLSNGARVISEESLMAWLEGGQLGKP